MWKLDKSIIGKKYGSLTVLDDYELLPVPEGRKGTKTRWKVRCDCGNEFYIDRHALLKRKVMYCKKCRPSGVRNTRLYHIYYGIRQRCFNSKDPRFEHYGGRGITVCDEWLNSYDTFRKWSLAHGYKERSGLSIDRIDNDGNYCPENCQWITIGENSAKSNLGKQQNFSKLKYIYAISPDGERVDITNISRFAREHGIIPSTMHAAVHGRVSNILNGWEIHSPESRQESVTTIESAC